MEFAQLVQLLTCDPRMKHKMMWVKYKSEMSDSVVMLSKKSNEPNKSKKTKKTSH